MTNKEILELLYLIQGQLDDGKISGAKDDIQTLVEDLEYEIDDEHKKYEVGMNPIFRGLGN